MSPIEKPVREYLSLGAGFSREEEMEDTRREVEK
jgi:hypothetical protein